MYSEEHPHPFPESVPHTFIMFSYHKSFWLVLLYLHVFRCYCDTLTVPPISPLRAVHSSFTANSNEHDYAHENIVYSVPMCFSVICYPAYTVVQQLSITKMKLRCTPQSSPQRRFVFWWGKYLRLLMVFDISS